MEYSGDDFHCNNKMQKLNTQSSFNLTLLPGCVQVSESPKHPLESSPNECLLTFLPQPLL